MGNMVIALFRPKPDKAADLMACCHCVASGDLADAKTKCSGFALVETVET